MVRFLVSRCPITASQAQAGSPATAIASLPSCCRQNSGPASRTMRCQSSGGRVMCRLVEISGKKGRDEDGILY